MALSMVIIVVRLWDKIWIDAGNKPVKHCIQLFFQSNDWSELLKKKEKSSFFVTCMDIPGGKIFLCMETTTRKCRIKQECFPISWANFVTIFRLRAHAFQFTRARKPLLVYLCGANSGSQMCLQWKHLFAEQTKVNFKTNISKLNISQKQVKTYVKHFLSTAKST